jgi:spore coat polysaccharide biosynthesis predicted glycosyltransferase SpsG/RimJ/RimL family protein N-acetyltransferase
MTTLVLRADATPAIGVGHLSRCVALAEAARARGWDAALCGEVTAGGWLLGDLPLVPDLCTADVVVVDHYALGALSLDVPVVSMEDGPFGRRRADVVVDSNLASSDRPDDGSPLVLRGPGYAPLRAEVRAARARRRAGATPPNRVVDVVVVMGGGAVGEPVAAAMTALRDTGVPVSVRAVTSADVVAPAPAAGQRFAVTGPTSGLPAIFAEADLVVSAAGVTLLELCCVGVPTALVQVADNQAAGYRAAVERRLVAGMGADPREHVDLLRDLLLEPARRDALAAVATATVDGQGADRILDALGFDPTVRSATEADAELLLAWRNDPQTRASSRTTDVIALPDHLAWLRGVLADPDRLLFVAEHGGRAVGTVRFDRTGADRKGAGWEVSITVAPEARGRGLATPVLLAAERAADAGVIHAHVLRGNSASRNLFRRAGYRPDGPEWFVKP